MLSQVVDLDAADSKFVRVVESSTKDEPAQCLPSYIRKVVLDRSVIRRQAAERTSRRKSEHGRFPQPRTIALKTESVTPPDLLQYALLGDPSTNSTGAHYLRTIFRRRNVSSKDDASTKIQHLTHDFITNATKSLKAAGYTSNSIRNEKMTEDLRECIQVRRLERILTMLSTTTKGCNFIASRGKVVVRAIEKCWEQALDDEPQYRKINIYMIVEMLNNLMRNMLSKGVQIEEALCGAGLYYASEAAIFPAVRMYLEIAYRNGYTFDGIFERAVQKLQFDYVKENHAPTRWAAWKGEATRREELLQLITGWNTKEVSCSDFLSTTEKRFGGLGPYSMYIVGVGEMGFSNALWEEWQSRANSMLVEQRFKGQLFAMAFVLAKDPARALEVLKTIPADESASQAVTQIRAQIISHYEFHHLKHTEKLYEMVDKGIPTDPTDALETLEKLLLVDYPKFIPYSPLNLDWGSRGTDEGLLVMPTMGNQHIYFKPSGTRIRGERK